MPVDNCPCYFNTHYFLTLLTSLECFLCKGMKDLLPWRKVHHTMIFVFWCSVDSRARPSLLNLSPSIILSASKPTYLLVFRKAAVMFFTASTLILQLQCQRGMKYGIFYSAELLYMNKFCSMGQWVIASLKGMVLRVLCGTGFCNW